jgi:hypothetical protein
MRLLNAKIYNLIMHFLYLTNSISIIKNLSKWFAFNFKEKKMPIAITTIGIK